MLNSRNPVTKEQTLEFLRKTGIMSVALIKDNKPLSTVLMFAVDDDFTFYCGTLKSSYKAQAIAQNNTISFSIWEHNHYLVQANGVIAAINDQGAAEVALDKIVDAAASMENFWPPVLQIKGHDYILYKIVPEWLRVLDLTHKEAVSEDSLFTQIIG